jgi:hypothetical protein
MTYEKEEQRRLELMDRAMPFAACVFEPEEGEECSASKRESSVGAGIEGC